MLLYFICFFLIILVYFDCIRFSSVGGEHLPVLVMPKRCHESVGECPYGSQCRGGICFWSHCLADPFKTGKIFEFLARFEWSSLVHFFIKKLANIFMVLAYKKILNSLHQTYFGSPHPTKFCRYLAANKDKDEGFVLIGGTRAPAHGILLGIIGLD